MINAMISRERVEHLIDLKARSRDALQDVVWNLKRERPQPSDYESDAAFKAALEVHLGHLSIVHQLIDVNDDQVRILSTRL